MRSFFICVSALAFLFSELVGLVQGLSTMALITRSVVVFAVFFILGHLFCMFWQKTNVPEDDVQDTTLSSTQKVEAPSGDAIKKEEVIKKAAGDPKHTAQVINTLISQ
jgi:hypothetical protein